MRVAVQVGGGTARIAAPGAGGVPQVLAELPRGVLREPAELPGLLTGVLGPVPEGDHTEVVLVHPTGWPASRVAAWAAPLSGGGVVVVPVAAPVAAARGARVVLDVGSTGAEAAVVECGVVVRVRRAAIGGDRLDAVAARLTGLPDARATREALSLLPVAGGIDARRFEEAVTPLLREVVGMLRGAPGPVLLVGGVARMPLLAELVDAAGVAGCRVAARPESAAVLGALLRPARAVAPVAVTTPQPEPLLPEPAPHPRPVRRVLHAVAALAVAAALLGAGVLLRPPEPVAAVSSTARAVLVQYGYRFEMPEGWEHSGGLPERRRSLLTPIVTPEGSDLIAVERTPLGYDAGAEPERARAELRATFDAAVAAGSVLTAYGTTEVAGRLVTTYLQDDVEWFVVLDGDAQLSVGCRHTPAGERAVRAACAVVVGSVRRS